MTKSEQVMAALDELRGQADGEVFGKLEALAKIMAIDGMEEPVTDEQILQLAKEGLTYSEIQRRLHVSWKRMKRVAPGYGQKPAVSAEIIRPYIEEGYSHAQIAQMLGTTPKRIARLFPGTGWTRKKCGEFRSMIEKLEKI